MHEWTLSSLGYAPATVSDRAPTITAAAVADPLLVLRLSDGAMVTLRVDSDTDRIISAGTVTPPSEVQQQQQ